jgi:hypothetical protein
MCKMTTPSIHSIVQMLEKLPARQQKKAVRHLQDYLAAETQPSRLRGKAGRQILAFAGTISQPDLNQMQTAIESACEQVDRDEW